MRACVCLYAYMHLYFFAKFYSSTYTCYLYCFQVWHLYQLNEITLLQRIQFFTILNYKTCLINVTRRQKSNLSWSYMFEISDEWVMIYCTMGVTNSPHTFPNWVWGSYYIVTPSPLCRGLSHACHQSYCNYRMHVTSNHYDTNLGEKIILNIQLNVPIWYFPLPNDKQSTVYA